MLGKLSRWLRMIGYDTVYANNSSDQELLSLAKRNSLTLLTSDEELYRIAIAKGLESFLIEGRNEPERLANLAQRFNLNLRIKVEVSRCPVCNGPLKQVQRNAVKGRVPPATFKLYRTFWLCNNPECAKVYWQGSHWKRIEQTLRSARKILGLNKSRQTGPAATPKPRTRNVPRASRP